MQRYELLNSAPISTTSAVSDFSASGRPQDHFSSGYRLCSGLGHSYHREAAHRQHRRDSLTMCTPCSSSDRHRASRQFGTCARPYDTGVTETSTDHLAARAVRNTPMRPERREADQVRCNNGRRGRPCLLVHRVDHTTHRTVGTPTAIRYPRDRSVSLLPQPTRRRIPPGPKQSGTRGPSPESDHPHEPSLWPLNCGTERGITLTNS